MKIDFTDDSIVGTETVKVKGFTEDKFVVEIDNLSEDSVSAFSPSPHTSKAEQYADEERFRTTLTFEFPLTTKALGIKIASNNGKALNVFISR